MEYYYNSLYCKEKTFIENLHDCLKLHRYVKGVHYIEIDCGEYICICPFNYNILGRFRGFFNHCVCTNQTHFDGYFKHEFYERRNLKAFFFKKTATHESVKKDSLWEFTCWIYVDTFSKKPEYNDIYLNDMFYFLHNSWNQTNQMVEIKKITPIIAKNYSNIVDTFRNSKKYKELTKI